MEKTALALAETWWEESEPADSVLRNEVLEQYQQHINFFRERLTRLNINLFLVQELMQWPREIVFGPSGEDTIFFHMMVDNTLIASTLLITTMVTDQGNNYTLERFKNLVSRGIQPEFSERFKKRKLVWDLFKAKTKEILTKLEYIRNSRIAHASVAFFEQSSIPSMEWERVNLSELISLRDDLNLLFHSLTFGATRHGFLPISYEFGRSDVHQILARLEKTSDILHMPENAPHLWEQRKGHLTLEEKDQINRLRRKYHLPEV